MELTSRTKFEAVIKQQTSVQRVGVAEGALSDARQFAAVAALFPDVQFEVVGADWPGHVASGMAVLIAGADAGAGAELDAVSHRLALAPPNLRVVVLLRNADVTTTRRLMREGAADVIPAPVGETSLAVTLDKLLRTDAASAPGRP